MNPRDNFFLAGAVITAELRRAGDGWLITELRNVNVWRGGGGFANLAQTDKPAT